MTKIKNKDFVEIEYTGKIKDTKDVFDTTDEKIAKDNDIFDQEHKYKPIIICVGEEQIIKGLDKALVDKEVGKDYSIEVPTDDAYGKKNAKLIQLISTSKFIKQNIQPMPGLQVNIDGNVGLVKTVSGGRTLVDFNHPLASKDLSYTIKVNRLITDDKEKIQAYFDLMNLKDAEIKLEDKKANIKLKQDIPKEIKKEIESKIKELVGLDGVTITK